MAERTTVLFMTNAELSQSSVVLATSAELANDVSLDIHIASFAGLAKLAPSGVSFHCLPGRCIKEVVTQSGMEFLPRHAPGVKGAIQSYRETFPLLMAPWDPDEFFAIYDGCVSLVKELKPTLVVLDFLFGPGADACAALKQKHTFLSPGTFKDHSVHLQPRLQFLWKYPVVSSGFRVPIPIWDIFLNIYLIYQLIKLSYLAPRVKNFIKARNERGIPGNLSTKYNVVEEGVLYLTQAVPETDFPLAIVPPNVIGCGPILPPFEPLSKADPDLAKWLAARPTIIINMGSHVTYQPEQANEVLSAIQQVVDRHPYIQVLWKCPKMVQQDEKLAVDKNLASRIRIMSWLPSTPVACLTASSSLLAYVHHGGSNSYHEAIAAGVPQVVCPVWLDTYDFATRAELIGVGVRGNATAAPNVRADEFASALEKIVSDSVEAKKMRETAKRLAKAAGHIDSGRKVAAERIKEVLSGLE
ncbi:glycosyltransferase family 1 protein [Hypoxylon crocopeplum]|nr:glycosyltransferase family 1 protein [Hypoxylon crocopeplum]